MGSRPKLPTCTWRYLDSEHDDHWETECGEAHQFMDGGPKENKYGFCPYCGCHLREKQPEPRP